MKLQDIIRDTIAGMQGVSVEVDSSYSTVCISDDTGVNEDIFMQGEDAESFIAERDGLYEEAEWDCTEYDIELFLASSYVENLWN